MKKAYLNQVYRKFVKNMLVILILPLVILAVNYARVNRTLNEQAYETNVTNLENSAEKIEGILENLERIMIYFSDNKDIVNYFYHTDVLKNGSTTSNIEYARQALNSVATGNSSLLSIQLYGASSDTLLDLSTSSLYLERYYGNTFQVKGMDAAEWKENYLLESGSTACYNAVMTSAGRTREVFVYNKRFSKFRYKDVNNRVLFYIDMNTILQCFDAILYQNGGFVTLFDGDGNALIHSAGEAVSLDGLQMINTEKNSGYEIRTVDGQQQFVVYYRDAGRNWTYFAALPLSSVLDATHSMKQFMAGMLFLCVLAGAFLIAVTAKRLSAPYLQAWDILNKDNHTIPFEDFSREIKRIVDYNEVLLQETQKQIPAMRTAALYHLLLGKSEGESEIRENLELLQIRQDADYYCILILVCNNSGPDFSVEEISAQKVFIDSAFRQYGTDALQDIYQVDFERMVIVLTYNQLTQEEILRRAETLVQNAMSAVKQNIYFSISVSGEVVDHVTKLSKGFYHAQYALNVSGNIFGNSPVQWFFMAKEAGVSQQIPAEIPEDKTSGEVIVNPYGNQLKEYVDTHYTDPQLSLATVAEEFHITEVYVSKIFKKEIGQNFSKYIEQLRIMQAKRLIDEGVKIQDAAQSVGYNSAQVFRRAWKRYYEGTPSQTANQQSDCE